MLFVICVILFGVAVGLWWTSRKAVVAADHSEPICGKCNYCVRGLEGTVCPECGSDLNVVGVLIPGTRRPMSKGRRILIWTMAAPLPALFVVGIFLVLAGPQWLVTTQRRVIFLQTPYANVIITANATGKRLVFGTQHFNDPPVPAEVIFLSFNNPNVSLDIRPATKQFSYFDHTGKYVTGRFDAQAIEQWMNEYGITDPRLSQHTASIETAVNEIGQKAGSGFSKFPSAQPPGPVGQVVAHPTFVVTRPEHNELTLISSIAVAVMFWLAGLLVVLRRRPSRQRTAFVPKSAETVPT